MGQIKYICRLSCFVDWSLTSTYLISTFIFAGHDTTTLAVSRILHQLCQHQAVQEKLRNEVTAARKEHGDLNYDALMGLPFLDAVCRETLRVFPPVSSISRT